MRVKVVVLPVFKRQWLFYAWSEGGPDAHEDVRLDWKAGGSIQEKVDLLRRQWAAKVGWC